MRKRVLQEGSVGLLILAGLGLFGGTILWLQGASFGGKTYKTIVEFANVAGMRTGAPVRYRGVEVGRITNIQAGANGVDVTLEITTPNLVIPRNVRIEANQSGLIGETSVDITPLTQLGEEALAANPRSEDCNSAVVVCEGSRLQGKIGVSFDELLRSTQELANVFADPKLLGNLESATASAGQAAAGIAKLSTELSTLTRSVQNEIGPVAKSASVALTDTSRSVSAAADQIRISAAQATEQLNTTSTRTTAQLEQTTTQANQLLANIDGLITTNRSSLSQTLTNLNQASQDLRVALNHLTPFMSALDQSEFLANIEQLSANAAQASANLRDLSSAANNPNTLILLQQTLDSARATFQNAQKITADLDELTGDPAFRTNLRNLVNGLGNLVSSTEDLQDQTEVAKALSPFAAMLHSWAPESQLDSDLAGIQFTPATVTLAPLAQDKELASFKDFLNSKESALIQDFLDLPELPSPKTP